MTVYVIDDHPLMRDALTMLIHRVRPGLKVVSVHKMNVLETAVELLQRLKHGSLDLQLPDGSSAHVGQPQDPRAAIRIKDWVTSSDAGEFEARCLEAGADVFIEKSNNPNQIIAALKDLLVPEDELAAEADAPSHVPTKLSKRQKQLILMLDQGLSNRDIAEKLSISEHTVKVHLWRLFRRLNVKSRSQASHLARTAGLLDL